jgi:hypothetical protein
VVDAVRFVARQMVSGLAVAAALYAAPAAAQLRIVTYNTSGSPRSGMDFVLKSIGEEFRGGIVHPVDILLLGEQSTSSGLPDTQAFVNLLNSMYASQGLVYARSAISGGSLGDSTQTMVYKTNTVQLLQETSIGTLSSSGQPRKTLRYKVKPKDYEDSAAFYIYNSHYKASQGTDGGATTSNADRRLAEANAIRANADALGEGVHAIYAGDFNFYDSDADEPAFGALTGGGAGQAFDPLNRIGRWSNNSSYKDIHTQSPTTSSRYTGQVTGGMDDRFDFQLVTDEFRDNEGLSYINNTYHTFGNNGTTYNLDVDSGFNTYPFDLVSFDPQHTRSQLLTDLASVTDHLPVVADFRIPAKMQVQVASIPTTVNLGANIPIEVRVENIAPAINSIGADELDYTLSVSGDLTGGVTDLTPAASGPHLHNIFLNTATPGLKAGVITVQATSPQASGALFTLPVSFDVVGSTFLAADFDQSSAVDATDLASWSANFGMSANALKSQGDADLNGGVDGLDFLTWQRQRGAPASPTAVAGAAVPEPGGAALVAIGLAAAGRVFRRDALRCGGPARCG